MANGIFRWIGGGLGFVMGGPIGALIGYYIGSIVDGVSGSKTKRLDSGFDKTYRRTSRRDTAPGDFRVSLLVLMACVMKADGRAQKSELDVVKRFLVSNFGEEGALEALQLLKNLLEQPINEVEVSRQIGQFMNYSSRLQLLHFLFEIAMADGMMVEAEKQMLMRISANMGVSNADFDAILAPYNKGKDKNWAYTALEIEPGASIEEIKRAYRRMAMKFHPDKVASLGDDVKKKATERFRNVNEAYEELKKQRGFN